MLKKYIELGIPILIEGPTGSSKTLSSEIVCKYLEREIISINLSSDTTIGDLMGKLIGNTKTNSKISFSDGPFKDAFVNGKCLRLDEINLASESILQCIEQSLDSKILSIELNGCLFKEYKMHENFCLIATQNPKEGFYSNKRKEHSYRLLSRFQIIRFDEIDDIILEKIALGLEKRFSGKNNNNININSLIKI